MLHISSLRRLQTIFRMHQRRFHFAALRQMGVKGMELRMPALSPTMSEGTIVRWLKKEGDQVNPGDALCEIQTDKAVMTFDTEEEGVLAKILLPDDSKDIKIGTLIAVLVEGGQDWKDVDVPTDGTASVGTVASRSETAASQKTAVKSTTASHKVALGPAVKNLLLAYGLEQLAVTPSGPRNTLLKGDILKYIEAKKLKPVPVKVVSRPSPVATSKPKSKTVAKPVTSSEGHTFVDVPNSERRQSLARSSVQSKTHIPHSYSYIDCQLDNVVKLKKNLQTDGIQVTIEDFVVKATAVALQRVPEMNARWTEDGSVRLLSNIDIAVATQADNGPIAPIVSDVIGLGLLEISKRITDLSERASKGLLEPYEQSGAAFTVSYLGDYGVTEFVTIVPDRQSAVLAVGGPRIEIDEEGRPETRITAALSFDRRVCDEAVAARFLEHFGSLVECPSMLLASLQPSADTKSAIYQ